MDEMTLGKCCEFINGKAFKPAEWTKDGLPIVRIQNLNDENATFNYYNKDIEKKYIIEDGQLLFSWSGTPGTSFGAFFWKRGKAVLNQHIFKIIPKIKINERYLRYALNGNINVIISKSHGGVGLQHITKKELEKITINVPEIEKQEKIVNILENLEENIRKRKKQIIFLNDLIKSQFVEMFGNPISNDRKMNYMEMPTVCEIIDGDRGKNYPKAEEFFEKEYCLFLNAKNVTNNGFSFGNCMYITKEKDNKLRNGKLKRGDVVLTTRGTVGNLAFYTEEIPFENVRINSGMVILRMKKDIVNEIFFIEQFKMQLDNIKNKIANGSAQPQLPITKMNGIKVLIPPIELQNQFAEIVKQIDKQKFEIEKSLKETEELYKTLMAKYFE